MDKSSPAKIGISVALRSCSEVGWMGFRPGAACCTEATSLRGGQGWAQGCSCPILCTLMVFVSQLISSFHLLQQDQRRNPAR